MGRTVFVIGTVIAGTAALVASFFIGSDTWSANLVFFGPLLLGALVAPVAAGRAELLGMATAAFVAVGIIGLIAMGTDGRAEGGALVVFWVVAVEIAGLYGAVGLWRLFLHGKRRLRRKTGYEVAAGRTPRSS